MTDVEPIYCTDIPCQTKCGFNGGNSGYCSSCWKKLTVEQKKAANEEQKDKQKERAAAHERKLEEKKEEERKRARVQEEEHQEAVKKAKKLEEEINARPDAKCFRVAANTLGFSIDPKYSWLEWSWVKVGSTDMEGGDVAPTEMGSCGLYNAGTYHIMNHKHPETSQERMVELMNACEKLTGLLRNVEEGSSEGGEPYVGFFVLPGDMPDLSQQSTSQDIMNAVLGDTASRMNFEPVRSSNANIFDRYADSEDDEKEAYEAASALIWSLAEKGTAFRMTPAGNGDFYVGPSLIGARTPEGDIIGVRTHVVWT